MLSVDPNSKHSKEEEKHKDVKIPSPGGWNYETDCKFNGSKTFTNLSPPQVAIRDPFRFNAISYISAEWNFVSFLATIEGTSELIFLSS